MAQITRIWRGSCGGWRLLAGEQPDSVNRFDAWVLGRVRSVLQIRRRDRADLLSRRLGIDEYPVAVAVPAGGESGMQACSLRAAIVFYLGSGLVAVAFPAFSVPARERYCSR